MPFASNSEAGFTTDASCKQQHEINEALGGGGGDYGAAWTGDKLLWLWSLRARCRIHSWPWFLQPPPPPGQEATEERGATHRRPAESLAPAHRLETVAGWALPVEAGAGWWWVGFLTGQVLPPPHPTPKHPAPGSPGARHFDGLSRRQSRRPRGALRPTVPRKLREGGGRE